MAKDNKKVVKEKKTRAEKIQHTTDNLKKNLLIALKYSLGNVSKACDSIPCSRNTFYEFYNADEEFESEVLAITERAIDHVESKLHERIDGVKVCKGTDSDGDDIVYSSPPSDTAIIFYLKTKGRSRGYIEKTEQDLNIKSTSMTEEEKEARIKALLKKMSD